MSQRPTEILLVEDEIAHVRLIQRAFRSHPGEYDVIVARTLGEARSALARSLPEAAIVDRLLPDGNGIELLAEMKERPEFPIVVMTSHGSEEVAVEAMKAHKLQLNQLLLAVTRMELQHTLNMKQELMK